MASNRFIQGAIEHKGSLRKFAMKHHALNRDGTINLEKAKRAALKENEPARAHRLREINLARTLGNLRHPKRLTA